MAITHKNLKEPGYVPSTNGTLYTVPGSTKAHVKTIMLHNIDSSSTIYVKLHHVPSGDSAGDSNEIFYIHISPRDTIMLDCIGSGLVMDTGDTIQGVAGTASKIVCALYGAEDA